MEVTKEILIHLAEACYNAGQLDGIAQNNKDFKDSIAQVAVNLVIDILEKEPKK